MPNIAELQASIARHISDTLNDTDSYRACTSFALGLPCNVVLVRSLVAGILAAHHASLAELEEEGRE